VDLSVFGAAQPIYTAAPLFVGMADPLPRRLAVLTGAVPEVPVPDRDALAPPLARRAPPPLAAFGGVGATARLAGLLCAVRGAPEGERHRALLWAACRAGEMVARGEADCHATAAALARAAMDGGGRDQRKAEATARDGILRAIAEGGR
jgi:hypothetical protein